MTESERNDSNQIEQARGILNEVMSSAGTIPQRLGDTSPAMRSTDISLMDIVDLFVPLAVSVYVMLKTWRNLVIEWCDRNKAAVILAALLLISLSFNVHIVQESRSMHARHQWQYESAVSETIDALRQVLSVENQVLFLAKIAIWFFTALFILVISMLAVVIWMSVKAQRRLCAPRA